MKRSVVMMACVLSGAMVLGSFSPVMAETGAKAVSATVTDSKSSDDKKDDAKADTADKKDDAKDTVLEDGTYSAEFDTDSGMFHVNEANDGKGTLTLNKDFGLKELTEQQEDIKEKDLKFSMNFKLPFRNGNKLKFGAKVVRKTKDKEVDFYEYTPKDEEAFMANSLQNTVDQTNKNFMPDHKYQAGIYADKQYVGSLDLNNPSLFDKEQVQEELAGFCVGAGRTRYYHFNGNCFKFCNTRKPAGSEGQLLLQQFTGALCLLRGFDTAAVRKTSAR